MGPDGNPRTDAGRRRIDRHPRTTLTDIGQWMLSPRHAQSARPVHVIPLRFIAALAVEHLHAVVLAIRDVHPAGLIAADVMDDVERAWIGSGLAPRELPLAVWRIFVHPRVAVAVGDVD